jgi:SulP family sulfate permease
MLGAIESLLSAVVADGMTRTRHDPDAELIALGIGNILCPFFGGIPATGAIARTATNVRFGARSPISAAVHALFVLLAVLILAPLISYLPMAALAALLLMVAYNMAEIHRFKHILKVAPRSDSVILLMCFSLTVLFDMVIGVTVGVVLAALMFMRRMADITDLHPLPSSELAEVPKLSVSTDVVVYEIEGPLFFGAADRAINTLADINDKVRGIIFTLDKVPVMDITGLVAFEGTLKTLVSRNRKIALVGLRSQPKELMERAGLISPAMGIASFNELEQALEFIG